MTAMRAHSAATAALLRVGLPRLPHDADGAVFKAPWEAQAFAMTLALHERGAFSWTEWAETLAAVIAEVRQRGEADSGERYYRHLARQRSSGLRCARAWLETRNSPGVDRIGRKQRGRRRMASRFG